MREGDEAMNPIEERAHRARDRAIRHIVAGVLAYSKQTQKPCPVCGNWFGSPAVDHEPTCPVTRLLRARAALRQKRRAR